MKASASPHSKAPFKFRIPTAENLVPIRLDIEIDGQRFKDAFTWNPSGQDMYTGEKIIPIKLDLRVNNTIIKDQFLWDLNNYESDPEEFSRTLCKDLGIDDPEVGPAIAVAIREQLYEIAVQNVASARESRMSKKGRRGFEHVPVSKTGGASVDLVKLFGHRSSVVRKRKDWDIYEPIVDLLSNEEVDALEAKEERIAR
ncbi:chromatin structure-remodeling complex protein BSH isoform X2 [Cucumis melo]|uniref:Chromatin structure-remodeling complex protein BSH isoform X2 n=1 Tax=Cucumis melo TaxID=3656 RepID=A0A1S3AYD0_CUCME|nr:chromatin structure-remodeling complex protein BSH isoform X2 [Cucumis melo]